MTRTEILDAVVDFMRVLRDTPYGDALADLLALRWPDAPPLPLDGVGAPFDRVKPLLETLLIGWDHVARQNTPAVQHYREAARAIRLVMATVEAGR